MFGQLDKQGICRNTAVMACRDSKVSCHDEDHISSYAGPIAHKFCRDRCKNMIHGVLKGFHHWSPRSRVMQRSRQGATSE
jgi:hypothetical protein